MSDTAAPSFVETTNTVYASHVNSLSIQRTFADYHTLTEIKIELNEVGQNTEHV